MAATPTGMATDAIAGTAATAAPGETAPMAPVSAVVTALTATLVAAAVTTWAASGPLGAGSGAGIVGSVGSGGALRTFACACLPRRTSPASTVATSANSTS